MKHRIFRIAKEGPNGNPSLLRSDMLIILQDPQTRDLPIPPRNISDFGKALPFNPSRVLPDGNGRIAGVAGEGDRGKIPEDIGARIRTR